MCCLLKDFLLCKLEYKYYIYSNKFFDCFIYKIKWMLIENFKGFLLK